MGFASSYNLTFKRNDKVHALIVWFDTLFSHGNPPNKLSTTPMNRETHWKQTVFYLDDTLHVRKNETMTGSIALKKCVKNPRELDIKLSYHFQNDQHKANHQQFYRLC